MDNIERVKAMKRLYYYKKKALKEGDTARVNVVEQELENLRVRKKDDPKYLRKQAKRKGQVRKRSYQKQLTSGYFRRQARKYRHKHPDRIKKACHKWYMSTKKDPKKYKRYLSKKRIELRKLRKRSKVTNNV